MRHGNDADRILPDEVESMTIDNAKLSRRIAMLVEAAKRRNNNMTRPEMAEYLSIEAGTLQNMITAGTLYKMKVCDLVMIEKLAGDELDRTGLERR